MFKAEKTTFFLLIIFSIVKISQGQTLPFRNYQKENGLADMNVNAILQDARGYLWFATEDGLSRFDGQEFTNYSKKDGLPDNSILALLEDRQQQMWICTSQGGISCFAAGHFKNYSTRHGLPSSTVWAIAQDRQDTLWLGTKKGLCRFNGKTFKTFTTADGLSSNNIFQIALGRDGKLWLATENGLNCSSTPNVRDGFIHYSTADGLLDDKIVTVYHDSRGRTWAGTKKGLNCFQGGKITAYTTKDGLVNDHIFALYEDRQGKLWIGTLGGISIFSREKFTNYTTKNGLVYNYVHGIMQDREGNTWLATSSGASCLRSLNIMTFSEKDGLINNLVNYIMQDRKGRYWLATGNGLSCFYRRQFKNYTKQDGLISPSPNGLMEDHQGNIWVTTAEGLSVFSPRTHSFTNYTTKNGLSDNILFQSIESRDGTVWIGNKKGVICCKDGKFFRPPFQIDSLVLDILEDSRGDLWFASDSCIYQFSRESSRLTRFTAADGLLNDDIYDIFSDSKGRIWIGSKNGLSCYVKVKNSNTGTFTGYTSWKGLEFKDCTALQEDRNGNIWIASGNGLVLYNGKDFKFFNRQHGLPDDTYLTILVNPSGTLWLGGVSGFTRFTPPPGRVNRVPPPVYITNIKVLEKETPLIEVLQLKHNQNYIRFGFVGICFSNPEGITYKYRLKGIDQDWLSTKDRSVFYSYLPPGTHTFRVKAVNYDGIESKSAAELRFTILPPFWKTWWFYTLLVLSLSSALLALVVWRFKRSKEKLILKARTRQLIMSQRMELMGLLAASAVHDLKNLLSIIIGYSEIAAEKYQQDEEIYKHNDNIAKTAKTAVHLVKQILSLARQKYDKNDSVSISDILDNILELLKVISPGAIKIQLALPTEEIYFRIDPVRFQQLVMNLCINALQAMPEGGELKISLNRKEQHIHIEISDTGTGMDLETQEKIFDPLFTTKEEGKGTGLGLFVVKQIIDEYQGRIQVQSQPGKGTTFYITF